MKAACPVGKLIRVYRARGDMTSASLAEKMGISKAYLSAVETGEKSLSRARVVQLAHTLEMSEADKRELAWLAVQELER